MATANDYERSAGTLRDGVLTLHLVARPAQWHPTRDSDPALPVDALSEEGKAPSVPGPLLRAPVGTRVRGTLRNALAETLVVNGLRERGPGTTERPLIVPPGESRPLDFTINVPGAYGYYSELHAGDKVIPGGHGTSLVGIIIGDTARAPRERIMATTFWNRLIDSSAKAPEERVLFLINGKIWPHTPRFTEQVGDTVRWRVVDLSFTEHPMHLHGFYFRVDSRGTLDVDSAYTPEQRRMVVTEATPAFGNFTLTWVPERAGNWIFHCHKPAHTWYGLRYTVTNTAAPDGPQPMRHDVLHVEDGMSGLVVAISVRPRGTAVAQQSNGPRHRFRVLAQQRAGFYGVDGAGLGYVMRDGDAPPAADSIRIPGAPIVTTRGVPAEITVVNRTAYATAVHWHGIELESYYDGVAGWSGAGKRLAPMIAPGDSFVARFTPPRAGTFIYHAHADDAWQMSHGLYAPLIVLEPGERWDPATDHVLLIAGGYANGKYVDVLNGSTAPPPLELRAGVKHRIRVINVTADEEADLGWFARADTTDSTLVTWRAIAKDGAYLPARVAIERPATVHINPGETWDFEVTPKVGDTQIRVRSFMRVAMPVVARE
ncbi:MAG TPA: multicopper oxidase domain-containing protein [Gemmatimonadaceae bacterium]|nr:multicopper oxidase domain-containing protein [Gemmatimonadaceae bacterium]